MISNQSLSFNKILTMHDLKIIVDKYQERKITEKPEVLRELEHFYQTSKKSEQASLNQVELSRLCYILSSEKNIVDPELAESLTRLANIIAQEEVFQCFRLVRAAGLYTEEYGLKLWEKTKSAAKKDLPQVYQDIYLDTINKLLRKQDMPTVQKLLIQTPADTRTILNILNYIITYHEKLLPTMIEFLAGINFPFDVRFENGDTLLIRIIKSSRNADALNAIIKGGADVNAIDRPGNNAIDYAILLSKLSFVKILLKENCLPRDFDFSFQFCINKKTNQGAPNKQQGLFISPTVISNAAKNNLVIIKLLMKQSERDIRDFQDSLKQAVSCQNQDIVKRLLMMSVPVYESMVVEIIKTNNIEFAKNTIGFFLKKFPELIPSEFLPNTIPVGVNQHMFAFCYYSLGMIPDGFSSVHIFLIPEAVKYVLENGIMAGREKFNDVNMVALPIHPESLAMLIAEGLIDNEKRNRLGSTFLHIATYFMRVDTLKLLLLSGANPDVVDGKMQTPLDIAMEGAMRSRDTSIWLSCAKILLQSGARIANTATVNAIKKYLKPEQIKRESIYANGAPSLFCIATRQIMVQDIYKDTIKNLSYRNNLPLNDDCVKQFEEQALKIMTPK